MRCVVVAMVGLGLGLGLAQPASAADYGYLRGSTGYGPAKYRNWEGFYVGGQAGTGGGGADFGGDGNALIANLVRYSFLESEGVQNWSTTGKADTGQELQYGFFVGYNAQWGDVVLGIEASYNHTDLSAEAGGSIARWITSGEWRYGVGVASSSTITLHDFGTIRGRVAYAFDRFLPYATAGVALGRASYVTTASVGYDAPDYLGTTVPTPPSPGAWSDSASSGRSNALIYGWSAGLGMDVALTHNIFLRAEYEYIQFSQMKLNLNNARAGIGVKF